MKLSLKLTTCILALVVVSALTGKALAQPGTPLPINNGFSDLKPGSVLMYPYYTSHLVWPNQENTRINITNTHITEMAYVHLFFVDAATCQSADSFVCLTPNQTFTFVISDYDPGITGYLLAVAVHKDSGMPIQFNHLIGDYYVKLQSGHNANLGALAFSALKAQPAVENPGGATANIKFDDVNYNAGPRALALNGVPSRLDGNDTMMILTRLGGDLAGGDPSFIGGLMGLTYDDVEKGYSFTLSGGKCQFRGSITDTSPRMVPRFTSIVKSGRLGWIKIWPTGDIPIVGVMLNHNPTSTNSVTNYSGGHNMHVLTTSPTGVFTLPLFIPSC